MIDFGEYIIDPENDKRSLCTLFHEVEHKRIAIKYFGEELGYNKFRILTEHFDENGNILYRGFQVLI